MFTTDGHGVAYNYLVIATGHNPSIPRVRRDRLEQFQEGNQILLYIGCTSNSYTRHIISFFFLCSIPDNMKIKTSKSILIIGGGPAGVELAAEIAVDYPDKKVTLVHNGPRLMEFIGSRASTKALQWLKLRKVEILLDQSIDLQSISEADKTFTTSAGEIVTADCYFVCLDKPVASTWLRDSLLKERINRNGRLMVDENLRVAGHKNIFAIGDITDIPVSTSHVSRIYPNGSFESDLRANAGTKARIPCTEARGGGQQKFEAVDEGKQEQQTSQVQGGEGDGDGFVRKERCSGATTVPHNDRVSTWNDQIQGLVC